MYMIKRIAVFGHNGFIDKTCITCGNKRLQRAYPNVGDYEYGTYHNVDYLRCSRCGLVVQHPLPSTNIIPSFYPLDYRNHLQLSKRSFYALLKNYQINNLARDIERLATDTRDSLLEIGCGNGLLLTTLQRRGFHKLWGTDISQAALSQKNIVFRRADIEKKFPFRQRFDMIILNHVIEHLFHPALVLARCKEHLSDTGKIIIITPNSDSILLQLFKKYCDGLNAPRHTVIFSHRSMEYLKKKIHVQRLTYYPVPDPMQWAISLQNVLQQIPFFRVRLQRGLAWYTIFFGIVFTPISLLTVFGKKSASMMYVLE